MVNFELTIELVEELENKNAWLDLHFEVEERFNTLEEMLDYDKRVKSFYFESFAIIHSKDLRTFLNDIPFKPSQIQTLGDANIGSELLSESSIEDILTNNELADEILEFDKINELVSVLVERCRDILNNLPEKEICSFNINYPDRLVEKEAEKILLPYYLEYREKLKEEFIRTDNILSEKINKIQNEL